MEAMRVFLSSPGDVAVERERARQVVARLNAEFGRFLQIELYCWEEHGQSATAHFQEQIEDPAGFDLVVCLLWARLGSLLPATRFVKPDGSPYRSGTEYELDCALRAFGEHGRPDVWVYRNFGVPSLPIDQSEERQEAEKQWQALNAFWDDWFRHPDGSFRSAFNEYRDADDFAGRFERDLRAFCRERTPALPSNDAPQPGLWSRDESPFRGLLAFQPEHAEVFFGRRAARERLLAQCEQQAKDGRAFVLVLGQSGCGKSSLVQAGLVPWLTTVGAAGIDQAHWHWTRLQPGAAGADLLAALATTLLGVQALRRGLDATGYADANAFADLLRRCADPADHALLHRPLQAALPEDTRVLLFLDQFEELFAAGGPDLGAQTAFVAALAALAVSNRFWIVATLRSDCYAPAAALAQLVELKAGAGTFDLAPPGAAELGEIVRYPARAARLEFEHDPHQGEALDDLLVDTAAADPGALPLLEFTLDALYEQRDGSLLTLAAYRALGGLSGAIGTRAEQTVQALPEALRTRLPRLFRALVTLPDGGQGHSARTLVLATLTDPDLQTLASELVSARLLVADRNPHGQPVLRLAHEALLEHWPTLKDWRDKDRDFLRLRSRLDPAAQDWQDRKRNPQLLLPEGLRLQEGLALLEQGRNDLEAVVIDYIEASRRSARQQRQQRTLLLAAVFTVIAATAAVSIWQWQRAESNLQLAETQRQLAETQQKRAEQQKQLALQAIYKLTYDLPERLRRLPQSLEIIKNIFEENAGLLEKISALEGSDAEALREKASNLQRAGDMWLTLGETDKALAVFNEFLSITTQLVAKDPNNRKWQRDLSVSHNKIGDVRTTQGDLAGALAAYQAGLEIRQKLAALDPGKRQWQRDLSVSNFKLGVTPAGSGGIEVALAELHQSEAIHVRLVALDGTNTQWHNDLETIRALIQILQ